MKKFLITENGNFYKANLHVHTNVSDGKRTPEEIKEGYKSHGYSVVAFTDHEVFVPHNALTDDDFVAINGTEVAINDNWPGGFKYNKTFHINLYARSKDKKDCCACTEKSVWLENSKAHLSEVAKNNNYQKFHSVEGINDLIKRADNDGFLVCYNHPVWSMHNYSDYSGLKGLFGIEVYNTSSARGGYVDTDQPFEDLLNQGENLVPIASDDAHDLNANAYGGWTMIKADELTYECVIDALERKNCYSSNGPEIKELYFEDGAVNIKTSESVFVYLRTNLRFACRMHGSEAKPITEARFDITDFIKLVNDFEGCRRNAPWFRIEVVDKSGNHAWTRAYFLDELEEE